MHDHASHGRAGGENRRALTLALILAATYMFAELLGGIWTQSLALLADAGHMASDVAALALSLFALWAAGRPADSRRTFGYYRAEILAALAHGAALVVVSIFIAMEAVERIGAPRDVLGGPMMVIAAGGLAVNLLALRILNRGRDQSLNVRGAWLHVLSDAVGSVGAILAGALIWVFHWNWVDPLISLGIAALVVYSSWALLAEAVSVLLEGAPRHIDVDQIRDAIVGIPGVLAVHDLHVWTITSGMVSLSCHIVAKQVSDHGNLLAQVNQLLDEQYGIDHTTLQIEPQHFEESDVCD